MFKPNQPHGLVQGTGVAGAQFYQDGHYYGADHGYLFSDPGIAGPPGKKYRSMEQAEAAVESARTDFTPPAAMGTATHPEEPAPLGEQQPPKDEALTREQQLMQFGVPKLQQFQLAALQTMEPTIDASTLRKKLIGGPGAKAKLVEWLLAYTSP